MHQGDAELLLWARERAMMRLESLTQFAPKPDAREREEEHPTPKQFERFTKTMRTSVGYLFPPKPPAERTPSPLFRTARNESLEQPNPDLLGITRLQRRRATATSPQHLVPQSVTRMR